MRMRRIAISVLVLGLIGTGVFAQSGEPEYFRITGLKKKDERVNVRKGPNAEAKIVGKIANDTDGIKNHGCKGGLTPKQYAKASEAKKKAAERDRWCEVSFEDVKGWVSGRFLAEGSGPKNETPAAEVKPETQPQQTPPAQTTAPSFDCTKAEKTAEKFICSDNELATLDLEVARLYKLASDALNATPGFEGLLTSQRKWLDQRNTCFDRDCVAEINVRRVHQLRQEYKETRVPDGKSVSMGPLLARCESFPVPIAVTYINTEPGYAHLEWLGEYVVVPHVPAGSGVRYEGNFAVFHTKGDQALVKLPSGKGEMNCKLNPGN